MTDKAQETTEFEDVEFGSIDDLALETQAAKEQPAGTTEQQDQVPGDSVPDKYKGKSLEEIINMHSEAERRMSQQGNELGELRKLTDSLLQFQNGTGDGSQEATDDVDIDYSELVDDPKNTVGKLIENNPVVKTLMETTVKMNQERAMAAVDAKHPTWRNDVASQEFIDWAGKSKYRLSLVQKADQYDAEAADELFTEFAQYKEIAGLGGQEQQASKEKNDKTLNKLKPERNAGGATPKKIYRRADLIQLKIRNPRKYAAMQDEISAAYAEGRVK